MTDPGPGGPRVSWRDEPSVPPDDTTLLRLDVGDLNRVMKLSLTWWSLYADILRHLNRPGDGALVLSVFTVTDAWPVERLMETATRPTYRTTTWGQVAGAGYELWPTDQWDVEGRAMPRNEVHYDLVLDDSGTLPEGIDGGPAARREARKLLAPAFERALTLFGDVTAL